MLEIQHVIEARGCVDLAVMHPDQFGTFAGDVHRTLPPLQAAREKALLGIGA